MLFFGDGEIAVDEMSADEMLNHESKPTRNSIILIERAEKMCELAKEKEKAVDEKQKLVEAQMQENIAMKKALLEEEKRINEERAMLAAEKQEFDNLHRRMEEAAAAADDFVELSVRGQIFATRKSNFMENKNTFFYGMLSSERFKPNVRGQYFLDRYNILLFVQKLLYNIEERLILFTYSYSIFVYIYSFLFFNIRL